MEFFDDTFIQETSSTESVAYCKLGYVIVACFTYFSGLALSALIMCLIASNSQWWGTVEVTKFESAFAALNIKSSQVCYAEYDAFIILRFAWK